MKEYFPKKTQIIGPLKDQLNNLEKNVNRKKLEMIKNKNDKKIILICPTGGDEWDILNYLKSAVDYNSRYILSPHWGFNREEVFEKYLKELKNRISSVKSTRKITSAMKMVAASKLRRAQDLAESSRVYADSLSFILSSLAGNTKNSSDLPEILTGRENSKISLLIINSSGL